MKVGDWVRSHEVGSKPAFVGQIKTITELDGEKVYRIRDADNKIWERDESQIAAL